MKETVTTCYMCDKAPTGDEHVPPKCIFPERKDLPDGVDYRKQLFTVPSCDEHNSKKSKDDEFLCYMLAMSYQINPVGRSHYTTKIRRAINRNSSLLKMFAITAKRVKVMSKQGGPDEESSAIRLDKDRFNRIIDRLGRAIYYLHYQEKWLKDIRYQAEFLHSTIDPENTDRSNASIEKISKEVDYLFSNAVFYGDNPEVFKYQAVIHDDSKKMRLHFYENCKLLLLFDS